MDPLSYDASSDSGIACGASRDTEGLACGASRRTRVKVCGITRVEDAFAAAASGVDAIGLVFFPPSPRHLEIDQAAAIARTAPPFITRVALFVDPRPEIVREVLHRVAVDVLQFHGDEPADFCRSFARPYLKALRVRPEIDLLNYFRSYDDACGWLLDSYRDDRYGGTGTVFDWRLVPRSLTRPVVLSGGLDEANVSSAVREIRPWAVDVSSGVESAKGIKDVTKIRRFIAAVREGDSHANE